MCSRIFSVQFGALTPDEIKKLAVVEIYKSLSKGDIDRDNNNTLYDEHMGVLQNGRACLTCHATNKDCPGHFGYIKLPYPIINKKYTKFILGLLNLICPECREVRISKSCLLMKDIDSKTGIDKFEFLVAEAKSITECPNKECRMPLPKFFYVKGKNIKSIKKQYEGSNKVKISAFDIYEIFQNISHETLKTVGFNMDLCEKWYEKIDIDQIKIHPHQLRPESFLFINLPVIPPISRSFVMKDGKRCDDDLTDKYNEIIKKCSAINKVKKTAQTNKVKITLNKLYNDLQNHVWDLLENPKDNNKVQKGRTYKSISQRTEGKGGRIKSNVGGKRTDFCARTVITPGGLFINADELGVPRKIAETLTVEEKVLDWNFDYVMDLLREKKINKIVRNSISIRPNYDSGISPDMIKKGDNVERHLRNGDWILFNRQPTLREESMMSFKVRIIEGSTFRLPLSTCQSFNADFDKL